MYTHTQLDTGVDGTATASRGWNPEDRGWSPVPKAWHTSQGHPFPACCERSCRALALIRTQGNQLWFQETRMAGSTGHLLWLTRVLLCTDHTSEAECMCTCHTAEEPSPWGNEGVARSGLCPFPGPAVSARQGAFLRGSSQGLREGEGVGLRGELTTAGQA